MSDRRDSSSILRVLAIVLLAVLLLITTICSILYDTSTGHSIEEWQQDHSAPSSLSVNINTASIEDLMLLNGMDDKTAERIVAYRERLTRFATIDELTNVYGITEEDVTRWTPYITV